MRFNISCCRIVKIKRRAPAANKSDEKQKAEEPAEEPKKSGFVWSLPKTGENASGSGLFGNSSAADKAKDGGLFGTTNGAPLFGDTSKPLFGNANASGGSLFGGATTMQTSGSLFGG